jgi:hypothetical protein
MELTGQRRMLGVIRGERVDRVPILPPIGWNPLGTPRQIEAGQIKDENFLAVAEWVGKYCDEFVNWPAGNLFDRRFLLVPPEYIETSQEARGGRVHLRFRVKTPKGELTAESVMEAGVSTVWGVEPLLKEEQDVERLLSVPFHFDPPDVSSFFSLREQVGEQALIQFGVSTPMVCVSAALQFERFLEWCASRRDLIERMIETAFERIYVKLEHLLKAGVGPVVWMGGSEQATPPMMSPRFYDELVVAYDSRLIELIHRHGALVHVHCHGRIRGIFDRLLEMKVDLLDPVEPPPDGDIELAEAKVRARGRMVLLGNIEFWELEFARPEEIERRVKAAIEEGGKEGMFLGTSATPIARLSERFRENAIQYMKSGLEYGRRGGGG